MKILKYSLKNRVSFFCFLFLLSSCSLIFELHQPDKTPPLIKQEPELRCSTGKRQYAASSTKSAQLFPLLRKEIGQRDIPLSSMEEFILFSLLQTKMRPDLASPAAKFAGVLAYGERLFQISSQKKNLEDESMPFLYALDELQRRFTKRRYSLETMGAWIDQYLDSYFSISKEFENFLAFHSNSLKADPLLRKLFFKGHQLVGKDESVRMTKLTTILKKYRAMNSKNLISFSAEEIKASFPQCTFNIDLYKNSIFLVNSQVSKTHNWSYARGPIAFIGLSGQSFTSPTPLKKTSYLLGSNKIVLGEFCSYKSQDQTVLLSSSLSRDSGQHLYHFLNTEPFDETEDQAFYQKLDRSRYIFLINPLRLIYESRRGSREQLEKLLKLDIPIYHSEKLGRLWGIRKFQGQWSSYWDNRYGPSTKCEK